jgi:hypothetical protein
MTREEQRLVQAMLAAQRAWATLRRAEQRLQKAWDACTTNDKQRACEALGIEQPPPHAYQLLCELGA